MLDQPRRELLGQIALLRRAPRHLRDGGSITIAVSSGWGGEDAIEQPSAAGSPAGEQ
ncbi:hypothetical protein [Saccharopolyspora spinosa]|uniref:hypothetical protein n=1 Tax=Saccharopolyspora spinosa TaxID=60894 RepID=UPI000237B034|nr:hypothetical protein [Saccharopolyspora spinosa]